VGQSSSDGSISALGAPDLLDGVNTKSLPIAIDRRINALQQRLHQRAEVLRDLHYESSAVTLDPMTHYNAAVVLMAEEQGRVVDRIVYKPMGGAVESARAEFLSIFANLVGLYTPLALRMVAPHRESGYGGIAVEFLEDCGPVPDYQIELAEPSVLTYLIKSRWLNQLVGNLHCWWGQFLVPCADADRYQKIALVDLDEAFCSVAPEFLMAALKNRFGKHNVDMAACKWLDREYDFKEPLGWCPDHYDSCFSFYAPLWRAYLCRTIDLDLGAVMDDIEETLEIPTRCLDNALRPLFEVSLAHHKNPWIFVPAARNPKYHELDFLNLLAERWRRSVGEYRSFLEDMTSARGRGQSALFRFYAELPQRPY
jgi:hypothetical protein